MKCLFEGCKAYAIKNDDYCIAHSQNKEMEAIRQRARARGGYAKKKSTNEMIEINSIADVKALINDVINMLRSGTGQPIARARALLQASQVMLACISDYELESRIAQIEDKLNIKS